MAEPMAIRVPRDNFGVPLPLVVVQFDEAIRLWHRHRHIRYIAGVYDAFRWLTAITNVRPVSRDTMIANPATILDELVMAASVASAILAPGAPVGKIHPEWAAGVENTLRWATGRSTTGKPPLPWPADREPAVTR